MPPRHPSSRRRLAGSSCYWPSMLPSVAYRRKQPDTNGKSPAAAAAFSYTTAGTVSRNFSRDISMSRLEAIIRRCKAVCGRNRPNPCHSMDQAITRANVIFGRKPTCSDPARNDRFVPECAVRPCAGPNQRTAGSGQGYISRRRPELGRETKSRGRLKQAPAAPVAQRWRPLAGASRSSHFHRSGRAPDRPASGSYA